MPKLSPAELNSRLQFDWNITRQMNCPLARITAFKSMADLDRRANPIIGDTESYRAVAYLVEYHIQSLVAAGKFHDRFDVSMDLLGGGSYPYSPPVCFVISRPIPWSPHFLPANGSICLGELWNDAHGAITVGHLVVHIARLLNFDEQDRESSYGGWNPKAVAYWRTVMKREPITKGLAYPVLPANVTHGVSASTKPLFQPAAAATTFTPVQPIFRPTGR